MFLSFTVREEENCRQVNVSPPPYRCLVAGGDMGWLVSERRDVLYVCLMSMCCVYV